MATTVNEQAVDVGPVDAFPEGEIKIVSNGRHEVGIVNVDGDLYGVQNVCPHRGAPICMGDLRGTMLPSKPGEFVSGLKGRVLHCPWHQWEFDVVTGESLFGLDHRRLVKFPVQVVHGRVLLSKQRVQQEKGETP
jgi:nitrite reductase (NADH) small subunit